MNDADRSLASTSRSSTSTDEGVRRGSSIRLIALLARLVARTAIILWIGGFLFYSCFVIHEAQETVGDHRTVGFITRRATNRLNQIALFAGVAAIVAVKLDRYVELTRIDRATSARRTAVAIFSIAIYLGCLAGLTYLHGRMDRLMNPETFEISTPDSGLGFYPLHRRYLWISTIQIFAAFSLYFSWYSTSRAKETDARWT